MGYRTVFKVTLAMIIPVVVAAGCMDNITAMNTNPNAPTEVSSDYLLPAAITAAVEEILGPNGIDRSVNSLWVQHLARLQYTGVDRYMVDPDFSDDSWSDLYRGPLLDLKQVIEKTKQQPNRQAVARILRAWIFMNMTDLWGSIPYFEALTGKDPEGTVSPTYDNQETIYNDLIAELKSAQDMINLSEPGFGSTQFRGTTGNPDLIYQGDMEKWRRFANSLRLRAGMRLSNVAPVTAAAVVAAAVSDGTMLSRADEARLEYPGTPPNENPMYLAFKARPGDYRVSSTMIDTLLALNDPRISFYAEENSAGEYRGMPNGLLDGHGIPFEAVSKVGNWFLRPNAPAVIQSYEEVLFLKAEAAQRGWIPGDAADYYYEGIRAAMERFGIASAEIDAYLQRAEVVYAGGAEGLQQIHLQKWIALYGQGPEAWAEWRRTGTPSLMPAKENVNADRIPVRWPYPASEQTRNNSNYQAALSNQGLGGTIDSQINTPLWWDVN